MQYTVGAAEHNTAIQSNHMHTKSGGGGGGGGVMVMDGVGVPVVVKKTRKQVNVDA